MMKALETNKVVNNQRSKDILTTFTNQQLKQEQPQETTNVNFYNTVNFSRFLEASCDCV
jgi:hypothetical protein